MEMDPLDVNSNAKSLSKMEEEISKMITLSLNEIHDNPSKQKEITALWIRYISNIGNFLFLECERTGNKDVYKKLIKSMMFK